MCNLKMIDKLDTTLSNGKFAIVERSGKRHAIKLTGFNMQSCFSEVPNEISPTGKSWVEVSGLYTWAVWNAKFLGYVDSL